MEAAPDAGGADVRLDGPLDLRALRLPPGIVRRTVTIDVGGFLCSDGAAWCGELLAVAEGSVDIVMPSGDHERLEAGAILFVSGLGSVELRCVGPMPAVIAGVRRTGPCLGSS